MNELLEVLKSVPDYYDDFVSGMLSLLKDDEENRKKVIEFIKEDSTRRTDDVIEYLDELGI